ncbi:hypothetical protein SAMN04515667_0094 [Formosa sp. Hel1_31_208]|uniref:hypothetical protein n=1 Tax=Formosa sp. Hel1_31_208 TaxID=1798225 RepID=UPI00087AB8B1|nr:hypothetical protein [Formosa sp. Hel1_31_208]SDR66219.1 hypothetical protein SAMN04515667_0094 [Formosa sp. Hel1_31_208]
MAPIKFDENIKDKLEKRILEPSSDAWNSLAERLNTHDKKNNKGLYLYIGIAASIIGVLFVSTLFFNTSEDATLLPKVVDTEIKNATKNKESIELEASKQTEMANSNDDALQDVKAEKIETTKNLIIQKTEVQVTAISEGRNVENANQKELINTSASEQSVAMVNERAIKKQELPVNKLTLDEAKVVEVVNQIKDLETKNGTVTDAEIENLLKQAEKDIVRQQIYNETTRTVDANALLQDVEDDLEQSFRTRVFETLKSSYKTVKTAVAERNN